MSLFIAGGEGMSERSEHMPELILPLDLCTWGHIDSRHAAEEFLRSHIGGFVLQIIALQAEVKRLKAELAEKNA